MRPTSTKSGYLCCSGCWCLLLQVDGLYLMMGRGLDRLHQVPAGNVIAIGGLGTAILKSATITSSPACRPLAPMLFQVSHLLTHSLTHSLACPPARSLDRLLTHSPARSLARLLTHSLTLCLFVHQYLYLCLSDHASIHPSIQFPTVHSLTLIQLVAQSVTRTRSIA